LPVELASSELPHALPSETITKAAPVFNKIDLLVIVAVNCVMKDRLS
jgi:hypothetical protein